MKIKDVGDEIMCVRKLMKKMDKKMTKNEHKFNEHKLNGTKHNKYAHKNKHNTNLNQEMNYL